MGGVGEEALLPRLRSVTKCGVIEGVCGIFRARWGRSQGQTAGLRSPRASLGSLSTFSDIPLSLGCRISYPENQGLYQLPLSERNLSSAKCWPCSSTHGSSTWGGGRGHLDSKRWRSLPSCGFNPTEEHHPPPRPRSPSQ